jgi:predicted DNA-binding protein (UPF0251 family)
MTSQQVINSVAVRPYTQALAAKLLGLTQRHVKRMVDEGPLKASDFTVEGGPAYVDGESLHAELRRRGLPVPGE